MHAEQIVSFDLAITLAAATIRAAVQDAALGDDKAMRWLLDIGLDENELSARLLIVGDETQARAYRAQNTHVKRGKHAAHKEQLTMCPKCDSSNIYRDGTYRRSRDKILIRRWKCHDCKKAWGCEDGETPVR